MKKLILVALTLLSTKVLYSLPIGNPSNSRLLDDGIIWDNHCSNAEPNLDSCNTCGFWNWDFLSLRTGYYGDFVFNRDLELQGFPESNIEHAELYTNAGLLVLNLCNRLDIYGAFGGTTTYFSTNATRLGGDLGDRLELETKTAFSWTLGTSFVFFENGCTSIGFDGKYFQTNPDLKRVSLARSTSVYPDETLAMHYHEWQLSVGISHRIYMFLPYFAVKFSHAKVDFDDATIFFADITPSPTIHLRNFENRETWGYAVGVSLVDYERMSLTIEARFRDEKALHINGQVRF